MVLGVDVLTIKGDIQLSVFSRCVSASMRHTVPRVLGWGVVDYELAVFVCVDTKAFELPLRRGRCSLHLGRGGSSTVAGVRVTP